MIVVKLEAKERIHGKTTKGIKISNSMLSKVQTYIYHIIIAFTSARKKILNVMSMKVK
jgi:hypothetical protein